MKQKIDEKLKNLYLQKNKIEDEIKTLELSLSQNQNKKLSKNEKIELFKILFITREDIFAKKWISKDGLKQNFFPITRTFKGNDYIPISNKDIELHLRGQIQLASYIINKENRSKYIVLELLLKDIKNLSNVLKNLNIEGYFEYNSYNSILVWIFFESEIKSKDAKSFAHYIVKRANLNVKIYPNQEFVTTASLGEVIELPLHWNYRDKNKTVFFDIKSNKIYTDQWQILQNIRKVSKELVIKLIGFQEVNRNDFMFESIQAPSFVIDIKLYDYLYIPTINLSKILINKLKSFATFDNPQVKILLSLRKPLYNTPRVIKNFIEDDTYLKLPRGLIEILKKFLTKHSIEFKIDNRTYFNKIEMKRVKFELRIEQKLAIEKISENDFCICVAPPGFGKTLIGAKMFELRACSTLIVVNKNILLNQWIDRFVDYFGYSKKDIGYLGKGHNKLNGKIDVATMQSLKNNTDIINNYSFVIVDECHHIPAITFELIIKQFFGKYILGLSATPKRKDGLEPILFQQLGKIAYEYKRKRTFKNTLEIVKTNFVSTADNYATLINELCVDKNRNNLILKYINLYKTRKILLLTDRIEHINVLEEKLIEQDIDYVAIHGSMSKQEQTTNMQLVEEKSLILATTSYFGEGIDFPHLNTIIFATPISYYGRLIQYLGRIGRGNQECLAIDFLDTKNAMLKSAYKKRVEGYKQMHYI